MAKLPGANRSRLIDEILDYMREQIFSGEFQPGMPLNQEQLSEELDVSRTPLREALRVLQSEGLLEIKRGNRVEVISAEGDAFVDALALREVVDGVAARIAAEGPAPHLGRRLEAALQGQRDALDPFDRPSFSRGDADFHSAIFEATENPYVIAQISLVRLSIQVFQVGAAWGRERAEETIEEHESIADKILSRRPLEAEELSRTHIHRVIDELRGQEPVGNPAPEAGGQGRSGRKSGPVATV
jgi:DNA-binding GntR family transcriptional regulator